MGERLQKKLPLLSREQPDAPCVTILLQLHGDRQREAPESDQYHTEDHRLSRPRRTATPPATSAEPRTLSKTAQTLGNTNLTCCPLADTTGYILYIFILFIIYGGGGGLHKWMTLIIVQLYMKSPELTSGISWHSLCFSFSFLAVSYCDFLLWDCG